MRDLYLGCLIHADPKKDEWFAQIVERTADGVLGYRVAASAMAIGEHDVLRKVCDFAGVKVVPPKARWPYTSEAAFEYAIRSKAFDRPEGIMTAVKRCGAELDKLAGRVALATALISLTETLRHG